MVYSRKNCQGLDKSLDTLTVGLQENWLKSHSYLFPAIMFISTFLWYRKSRLWKFYFNLLDDTIKQFKNAKIDRLGWEELAKKSASNLVEDYFSVLFLFEIDYLRRVIENNKHTFWAADKSVTTQTIPHAEHVLARVTTTQELIDETAFCERNVSKLFYWRFAFCGLGLFVLSLFWFLFRKQRLPGQITSKTTTPQSQINRNYED
jgi:hypothetical protein